MNSATILTLPTFVVKHRQFQHKNGVKPTRPRPVFPNFLPSISTALCCRQTDSQYAVVRTLNSPPNGGVERWSWGFHLHLPVYVTRMALTFSGYDVGGQNKTLSLQKGAKFIISANGNMGKGGVFHEKSVIGRISPSHGQSFIELVSAQPHDGDNKPQRFESIILTPGCVRHILRHSMPSIRHPAEVAREHGATPCPP